MSCMISVRILNAGDRTAEDILAQLEERLGERTWASGEGLRHITLPGTTEQGESAVKKHLNLIYWDWTSHLEMMPPGK